MTKRPGDFVPRGKETQIHLRRFPVCERHGLGKRYSMGLPIEKALVSSNTYKYLERLTISDIATLNLTTKRPGSSRRPSYSVWTTQFFCFMGLDAVQWQFGDKFSFNCSAEEWLNKF
jgi:hypothetical protein